MFRKVICMLSAGVLLVAAGLPAQASQLGTVRISPSWENAAVCGGTVTLYRMGETVAGGYTLTDGLADWTVWEGELYTEAIQEWILNLPRPGGISQSMEGEPEAEFAHLQEGLYLLVQDQAAQGYDILEPMLIEIPRDGQWQIELSPFLQRTGEPPKTGDRPAPIIGAMGVGFSITMLMILLDKRKK